MRQIYILMIASYLSIYSSSGQEFGPINTGSANFLLLPTDARILGIGGAGISLLHLNSVFYNGSTLLFDTEMLKGLSYSFSPHMRSYTKGFDFHTIDGYYILDKKNGLLGGFRYYGFPNISDGKTVNSASGILKPRDWAVDLGYTRRVNSNIAISGAVCFIHSIIGEWKASALSFDFGATYVNQTHDKNKNIWAFAMNISNLGSRLKYRESKENLPLIIKMGGSLYIPFSGCHKVIITNDIGYRLYPSDMQSIITNTGVEYVFLNRFIVRGGYFNGSKKNNEYRYGTTGVGLVFFNTEFNIGYVISNKGNPLNKTIQLSLKFNL